MQYVRQVKPADAFRTDGYDPQILYDGESCVIIGSHVPAGKAAPPHHYHPACDQLYYVVEGEMKMQLAKKTFSAGPDTLVYIPAGTPHHNWNEGTTREFHFEVLSPRPSLLGPIAVPTDSTEPADHPYIVKMREPDRFETDLSVQNLLDRASGSQHMSLQVARVERGRGEPRTHLHNFDQFYYILSGKMNLEIGLQQFTAGQNTLVVLPQAFRIGNGTKGLRQCVI